MGRGASSLTSRLRRTPVPSVPAGHCSLSLPGHQVTLSLPWPPPGPPPGPPGPRATLGGGGLYLAAPQGLIRFRLGAPASPWCPGEPMTWREWGCPVRGARCPRPPSWGCGAKLPPPRRRRKPSSSSRWRSWMPGHGRSSASSIRYLPGGGEACPLPLVPRPLGWGSGGKGKLRHGCPSSPQQLLGCLQVEPHATVAEIKSLFTKTRTYGGGRGWGRGQ